MSFRNDVTVLGARLSGHKPAPHLETVSLSIVTTMHQFLYQE